MYFQKSCPALQKPTRTVLGVAVVKPRKLNVPRADITGVNVVVGTVAVALAVDTLAVFWKKYQQRKQLQEQEASEEED